MNTKFWNVISGNHLQLGIAYHVSNSAVADPGKFVIFMCKIDKRWQIMPGWHPSFSKSLDPPLPCSARYEGVLNLNFNFQYITLIITGQKSNLFSYLLNGYCCNKLDWITNKQFLLLVKHSVVLHTLLKDIN